MFTNVRQRDAVPSLTNSRGLVTAHRDSCTGTIRRTNDMAQRSPALTAGGSKEAEIATPTRDAVYSPSTANATPAPLGIAIAIPTHKECSSHL